MGQIALSCSEAHKDCSASIVLQPGVQGPSSRAGIRSSQPDAWQESAQHAGPAASNMRSLPSLPSTLASPKQSHLAGPSRVSDLVRLDSR